MRWVLVLVMMMSGTLAEAKPTPPKLAVALSLSARIGPQPPVLKVVLTNPTPHEVELASVDNPVCWVGLYFTGRLMKPDLTELGEVKPCKAPGTETFALASKASFTVEVAVEKLFRKVPRGTYELDLQFDSGAATAHNSKLTLAADSTAETLRFTVAKRLKTITAAKGSPVTFAKGVKLELVGHGHKHMMEGSGPSPLMIAAKLVTGGKATEVSASVHGKGLFQLGAHVFSLVDWAYDEWMKLDYWGPIDLDR